MNKKGFFISILAIFSLIFLLAFSTNSSMLIKSSSNSLNKTVSFETRHAIENLHYLIDKASAQALLENSTTSPPCQGPANLSAIKTDLNPILSSLKAETEAAYGPELECSITENFSNYSSGNLNLEYIVSCTKSIVKEGASVFTINLEKTVVIEKNVDSSANPGPPVTCNLTITDVQGNYQEYP